MSCISSSDTFVPALWSANVLVYPPSTSPDGRDHSNLTHLKGFSVIFLSINPHILHVMTATDRNLLPVRGSQPLFTVKEDMIVG